MRRFLVVVLLLLSMSGYGQLYIGMRDSYYAQIGYRYKDNLSATLECSLFSEHIAYQKIRVYWGYNQNIECVSFDSRLYVSSLLNANYQDCGVLLSGNVLLVSTWFVDATINPHYDTGEGLLLCFSVGSKLSIYKTLSLLVRYSTIPEYRMPESRLRLGMEIKESNLFVKPEISFPVGIKTKLLRVLCCFGYQF